MYFDELFLVQNHSTIRKGLVEEAFQS